MLCRIRCAFRFVFFLPLLIAFPSFHPVQADDEGAPFRIIDQTPEVKRTGGHVKRGRGPSALDANASFIRFGKDGDQVEIDLNCSPEKPTYLTVKVWGNSGSKSSRLILENSRGSGKLLHQRKKTPFPDRFYYATYPIPTDRTEGNNEVTVTLTYRGPDGGPAIYQAYTHLGGYFVPPADELQGKPFELGPPRPDNEQGVSQKDLYEHWKNEANEAVKVAMEHQIYGGKYHKQIEDGTLPEWTRGAIIGNQRTHPGGNYRKQFEKETETYGGHLMRQAKGNMGALRHIEAIARAYHGEWSDYRNDDEILRRVVAAMDFYTRAQGKNGGFLGPSLPGKNVNWPTWLGGPERESGHHGLERGQANLYRAFHLLRKDIKKEGMLELKIDHDLNPSTPPVPRSEAYADMARRSYKRMSRQVVTRSVANQSLHNFKAAYRIYDVLKTTDPAWAKQERKRMIRLAKITSGVIRNPKTDHYHFSPKGLSNENNYSAGYGSGNPGNLATVARMSDFQVLKDRLPRVFRAYSHFLYPGNNEEGYRRLNKVEWISGRSYKGFPGTREYLRNYYAAHELGIPSARRHFELFDRHNLGRKGVNVMPYEQISGHTEIAALGAVERVDRLERQVSRQASESSVPPSDYRLPYERESSTAYVDEFLNAGSIRHDGMTLFFQVWNDHVVRLRHMTPEYDRMAHVRYRNRGPEMTAKFSQGYVLKTIRYGPFFIVMNGSEERDFTIELPSGMQNVPVRDLVSGQRGTGGSAHEIAPATSAVFVREKNN